MKLKLSVFFIALISLVLLSGCISNQPEQNNSNNLSSQRGVSLENTAAEKNTENLEINLHELQNKYNALNEKFSGCLEAKASCESSLMTSDCNCLEPNFNCQECPVPTDCTAVASSLSSQISDCIEKKNNLQNSFNACSTEKNNCISGLDSANAALAEPLNLSIYHYVKGNLFESGGYRYTQAFADSNTKKVFVGLDYSGGTDNFFSPSVSTTYGLNLVRWHALTLTATGTFETKILKGIYESDAGDTVLIKEDDSGILQLKIKSTEFDAGTSKEGLALRRITVLYVK